MLSPRAMILAVAAIAVGNTDKAPRVSARRELVGKRILLDYGWIFDSEQVLPHGHGRPLYPPIPESSPIASASHIKRGQRNEVTYVRYPTMDEWNCLPVVRMENLG